MRTSEPRSAIILGHRPLPEQTLALANHPMNHALWIVAIFFGLLSVSIKLHLFFGWLRGELFAAKGARHAAATTRSLRAEE